MGYTVLIPQDIPESGKVRLRDMGCTVKMGSGHAEADIIRDLSGCDALVARTAPLTRAVMEAGDRLRIISRFGVGVDNIDLAAASDLGIWVANTPEANSASVAQHAMALMLACAVDLVGAANAQRRGDFAYRNRVMGLELAGKTLAVIGLGRIGRQLAAMAANGFGMRVIAYDPYLPPERVPEGVAVSAEWGEVFARADFVSMNLPANDQTRGIVGRREFAAMKKTAYFINCARGEVVNETDLAAALRDGEIAGAALDVFEKEPPDADNPLLAMPNVIATPHDAAFTREAFDRMGEHMAKNIADVMAGGEPSWPVNRPAAVAKTH